MIINPIENPRPVMDLRGPDGNAYVIIGRARQYAKLVDMTPEDITKEMTGLHGYTEVVRYFHKKFGDIIDIILPNGMDPDDIDEPTPPTLSF